VFEGIPVRQWVLTQPHRWRYRLAYDHRLGRAILGVFGRAVLSFQCRRAIPLPGSGRLRRKPPPELGRVGAGDVLQRRPLAL